MTKSEIKDLIKELEELESEASLETERLGEAWEDDYDYQRGYTDGISHCLELLRGKSGYYD